MSFAKKKFRKIDGKRRAHGYLRWVSANCCLRAATSSAKSRAGPAAGLVEPTSEVSRPEEGEVSIGLPPPGGWNDIVTTRRKAEKINKMKANHVDIKYTKNAW